MRAFIPDIIRVTTINRCIKDTRSINIKPIVEIFSIDEKILDFSKYFNYFYY